VKGNALICALGSFFSTQLPGRVFGCKRLSTLK